MVNHSYHCITHTHTLLKSTQLSVLRCQCFTDFFEIRMDADAGAAEIDVRKILIHSNTVQCTSDFSRIISQWLIWYCVQFESHTIHVYGTTI